ncbi:MAG: type II toxin-antitoxin system death-on-curing family toxin [Planctomycetaceae bacterium]
MEPLFLTLAEVMAIHRDQIRRYGGASGVRDDGLLQSAVAVPRATFGGHYLHSDLYEMAAAYLYHLVSNHPFVDGNKRVGAVAADVFLALNNVRLVATQESYFEFVISVASGKAGKSAVAEFFRTNTRIRK